MNKVIRSFLLHTPQLYKIIYDFKNSNLVNFYLKKVHEPDFNAFKLMVSEQSQLFLDIGANVGMSALSIFTLKPNAKVISFEPNPINYSYLDKLANKFDNFQYLPVGLGDESTQLDFYYPIYNGKKMTALGSCEYEKAQSWLNKNTVYFFDSEQLQIEKITIKVQSLDSFQLEPEFIKIDVEGFEYQVLLGASETIQRSRPILLIESVAQNDQVHLLLKNWNYNCYKFYNDQFYLDEFNCDNNFFIPQEKTSLIQSYVVNQTKRSVAEVV